MSIENDGLYFMRNNRVPYIILYKFGDMYTRKVSTSTDCLVSLSNRNW